MSTSTSPSDASSHSVPLLTGTWLLSRLPGLVVERPLSCIGFLSEASILSMVEADIASISRLSFGASLSLAARSRASGTSRIPALRRFEQGKSMMAQTSLSGSLCSMP